MPAIPIRNEEEYGKIIKVLDHVGGTWHGVDRDGLCLLVTPKQYSALLEAGAVAEPQQNGETHRGKKTSKAKS